MTSVNNSYDSNTFVGSSFNTSPGQTTYSRKIHCVCRLRETDAVSQELLVKLQTTQADLSSAQHQVIGKLFLRCCDCPPAMLHIWTLQLDCLANGVHCRHLSPCC